MLTPVYNFKNNSYPSKRVAPYRPFYRFNNRNDSYSFKGSEGLIERENMRDLESLARAYKEIFEVLDLKTDEGIKKIEKDIEGLKLWKGITFCNVGKEKNTVYLNIPRSKKAGGIMKIVVSSEDSKNSKSWLIKDFSKVVKNSSLKSDNYEFYSQDEIEKYGINKDLKSLIEDIDPMLLKLRIAVQKRNGQDLKPCAAVLPDDMSAKLRNIKFLNSEIDSILDTKSRKTVIKLKDEFGDYNGITGQTAHMFKNVGPDKLKIVCSSVQNANHGEMMRLLAFNRDDEIVAGFLFKDFDKIVSNYNPKYIAVIPEKLNFVNINEIEDEKYSKELPELLSFAETKLKSFKTFLLTPPPSPKNTGFLNSSDMFLVTSILSDFAEVSKQFDSLSPMQVFKIKDSYPNLEIAAGKRSFTFKIQNSGSLAKKISVLPVQNKYNTNLTKMTVSYENGQPEEIFLLKDNNKVVKNYNPHHPNVIPEVLKFYDEDEIKTLELSEHLRELSSEMSSFRNYVFEQTNPETKAVKINVERKVREPKKLRVQKTDYDKLNKKAFKLLVKNCTEDFNSAIKLLNEKPEEFKEVMDSIQKRVDEYLFNKTKTDSNF